MTLTTSADNIPLTPSSRTESEVDVLLGFKRKYDEALQRHDVKTIVITGSSGKFCGGFDIGNLRGLQGGVVQNGGGQFELTDVSVRVMTELFKDAKKPTVAAINGFVLDSGLEIALTFRGRIVANLSFQLNVESPVDVKDVTQTHLTHIFEG